VPAAGGVIQVIGRDGAAVGIAGREQRGYSKILAQYGGQIGRRH
jgi:hypothetical protein